MQLQGSSRDAAAAATAALDAALAQRPDSGGRVELSRQLFAALDVLDGDLSLRRAVGDPAVAASAKAGLLTALFGGRLDADALAIIESMSATRWSRSIDFVDTLETLAASARFAAAQADGQLDDVEDELFRVARVLDREPTLHAALTSATVPMSNRVALIDGLLSGRAQAATIDVVERAVANPRGRTLETVLSQFADIAAARRSRVVARVTSARALPEAELTRLSDTLHGVYGHAVQLQTEVDAGLIGGLVVRVNDEIIDGSIRSRLSRARRGLA